MYEELQGLDSVVEPYLEGVDICSGCGGIKHEGLVVRMGFVGKASRDDAYVRSGTCHS
jgi:hypothetical protein